MTAEELSQLRFLNKEIEQQKNRLEFLITGRVAWKTHDYVMTSNGPGNTQKIERVWSLPDSDMDNPFREEVDALRENIRHNMVKCVREQRRLERYIGGIEDSEIRQIISLRYINGLPWAQVAAYIGEGFTDEAVKQACHRFLKKSQREESA